MTRICENVLAQAPLQAGVEATQSYSVSASISWTHLLNEHVVFAVRESRTALFSEFVMHRFLSLYDYRVCATLAFVIRCAICPAFYPPVKDCSIATVRFVFGTLG